MYTLKSNRLAVTIAEPNKEFNTDRFDRAGFIMQATLDGKHTFLGNEDDLDPSNSSGGMGLSSEILCDPISEEVSVGDTFPKFGVGNLVKPDEKPYIFMRRYEGTPFEITSDVKEDSVTFTTKPMECKGYAVSQKKTVSVKENTITVSYELTNEGTKEIEFEEYAHNFISFDFEPFDSDSVLTTTEIDMPDGKFGNEVAPYVGDGKNSFVKESATKVPGFQIFLPEQCPVADSYEWTLENKKTGMSIKEEVNFKPYRVTYWVRYELFSPETFFRAALKPGETASWQRTWTLNA